MTRVLIGILLTMGAISLILETEQLRDAVVSYLNKGHFEHPVW